MTAELNRQWVVAARPEGTPRLSDFEYREVTKPEPASGEILLRTRYLSLAPVMSMYMSGRSIAQRPPLDIGDVIHGRGVGEVVESRHPGYRVGDLVHGQIGWQTWKAAHPDPAERFYKFAATDLPAHLALGPLGMTGYSAYCGLVEVGQPQVGEAVLVSGAAGGVGHLVVQIARALDCRPVIGIAGGPAKCAFIRELGCHGAIDYKNEDVAERLSTLCPAGVNLYFDNVGGEILEAALDHLAYGARIVLCGSISEYTRTEPFGPRNYTMLRRHDASMRGYYVYNHEASFPKAEQQMAHWLRDGTLKPQQNIIEGFKNMPAALIELYTGGNIGKQVVKVYDERRE